MTVLLANNVFTTLASALTTTATSMTVVDGSRFPSPTTGQYFYATLISVNGAVEIVKVVTRSGNSMGIARAQEGTLAQVFAAGSRVEMRVTAASVLDAVDDGVAEMTIVTNALDARLDAAEATIITLDGRLDVAEPEIDALQAFDTTLGTSAGSNSVGFIQSGTGAVARTAQAKLRDLVSVKDFGAVGAASLQAALNASDYVFVNAGTYNGPIDITQSNKTLVMDDGVEFFLPNGTVISSAVTGPAVLQISGDNVTIEGDFTVNGNKANNDSTSIPTSVYTGSLTILGDNCRIYGTATVLDAYYRGITVGTSTVSGGEVQGFYANKLHVANANYYSVMLWSVVDWRVEEIRATTNAPGVSRDQRIRLGTGSTATAVCARGYLGLAFTDNNCGFIGEANTIDVSIGTVMTGDGGKLEDCTNVRVGHWNAYNCSRATNRSAFFLNGCENCHVDSVIVTNYNNDGTATPAITFNAVVSCSVGSIVSVGNQTNVPNRELLIRQADGLYLGSVVLRNPVGTCNGFQYDHGYPLQQNIVVDDLISRGHTTWDVMVENKDAITVRNINSDATNQYPQFTYYPNITDKTFYEEGLWTPVYTTTGTAFTSITYNSYTRGRFVRVGKLVHFAGSVRTDAITVGGATGTVLIAGLPFTSKNATGAYTAVSLAYVIGFAGDKPINGRIRPNSQEIEFCYRTTSNGDDAFLAVADMATGATANTMNFSGTYEIE
jgi:hypothetical protein